MPQTAIKALASVHEGDPVNAQNVCPSLDGAIEAICSAMAASGAVVALRDAEGVRCIASAGEAPEVGSRLQPDSTFTRACIETGEIVVCEDSETDSRITPSIARELNLRSAVAVPIRTQGLVIGLIEVFSSRPSGIYATDVAVLKDFANFFAPLLVPGLGSSAPSIERTSASLLSRWEERWPAGKQGKKEESLRAKDSSFEPRGRYEDKVGLPDSPRTEPLARDGARTNSRSSERSPITAREQLARAMAQLVLAFAGKSATARLWRGRAASLSVLALALFFSLFFVLSASFRPRTMKPESYGAAPSVQSKASPRVLAVPKI
jgi:GAF domain